MMKTIPDQKSYEPPRARFSVLLTEDFLSFNSSGNETLVPGGEEDIP